MLFRLLFLSSSAISIWSYRFAAATTEETCTSHGIDQQCRRIGGRGDGKAIGNDDDDDGDDDSSHTMGDSYQKTSGNQYSAHTGCQDMLLGCARRLQERSNRDDFQDRTWKIADLGSADGSNSIRTMDIFLDALRTKNSKESTISDTDGTFETTLKNNLHIVFEEHPASDEAKLTETVDSWLESKNIGRKTIAEDTIGNRKTSITSEVLMKSFYEPLFEANSIDFLCSYICLHWLDSTDARGSSGIRDWKSLHLANEGSPKDERTLSNFLQINERTAPPELKQLWKEELADRHLASFLTLRAIELKRGAEMLVVMVSGPGGYSNPPRAHESPLLQAMKKCVAEGSLRPSVLEQTIVPYYLRQPEDVVDALALAQQSESHNKEAPIHSLEIVELRRYETLLGGAKEVDRDGQDVMEGARGLFWAIHGGAVSAGGATEDELVAIQNHLVGAFNDSYDRKTGIIKANFIACVFRKNEHIE